MKTRIQHFLIALPFCSTLNFQPSTALPQSGDSALLASGQPIHINFDDASTPGGSVDATAYLASFGITLTSVTHDGSPAPGSVYIENDTNFYGGGAAFAASGHNFLLQQASGMSETYTLAFSEPLQSLSFTRCAVSSGAATPSWTATAYAGSNEVDSLGVCCIDSDTGQPAHIYALNGPGITSLTITANPENFAALGSAPLDDLYLIPQSMPDLQVVNITATNHRAREGNKVTITATVMNAGNADAGPSITAFMGGASLIDLVATPTIAAGTSVNVSIDWHTVAKNGQHIVSATANAGNVVAERNYDNNNDRITFMILGNQVR